MKVAFLTPLPPVRSGIAAYSAMLLPELAKRVDVTAVVDQERCELDAVPVMSFEEFTARCSEFERTVCQLGNNLHHQSFYRWAMEHRSVVVLHDFVLHHLVVEMTLARGDEDGYIDAMRLNHGEPGVALARARARGIHDEVANFLYPASLEVARRSEQVIVLNEYAAERLRDFGVTTPVAVTGHPLQFDPPSPDIRRKLRARVGLGESERVIGMIGFVTTAKRPEPVFHAFAEASKDDHSLRLLVVGEPWEKLDLQQLAATTGVEPSKWRATGYVPDDEFDGWISAFDAVVNLRYPSAGETSGPLVHALAAEKPVAVSDYAVFSTLPSSLVTKIPLGDGEVERLAAFMRDPSTGHDPAAQRAYVATECSLERVADQYAALLSKTPERGGSAIEPMPAMALFPQLRFDSFEAREGSLHFVAANHSGSIIRSHLYGEEGYRLVVRTFDGKGREMAGRWLRLRDLRPGESVPLAVPIGNDVARVEFHHGLTSAAAVETTPTAVWVRR